MEENVNIQKLEEYAKRVRRKILKMIYAAGSGHPGGSLSCVEILVALYKEAMDITLDEKFKRRGMQRQHIMLFYLNVDLFQKMIYIL